MIQMSIPDGQTFPVNVRRFGGDDGGLFQLFLTDLWEEDVPNRWRFVLLPYQITAAMTSFAKGAA
jgi:hypothetical protein